MLTCIKGIASTNCVYTYLSIYNMLWQSPRETVNLYFLYFLRCQPSIAHMFQSCGPNTTVVPLPP